jgi:hypothetical protein
MVITCDISGFRRGVVEAFFLLGCYRRWLVLVTDVSGQNIGPFRWTLEHGTVMFSRNVGNHLPTYAA